MQKIPRQAMIEYAKQEVARGSIYVWGAQGQRGARVTEDWIRKMETSTANANRAIALLQKNRAKYDPAMIGAFDCSGLIGACLNANGNPGFDDTADGYRGRCVSIGKDQLRPGDLVFEWNGRKSGHVGIYIGNGKVVEARGRDYGVVETDLNMRSWKKYGRPDFMYSEEGKETTELPVIDQPAEAQVPGLTRNLKLVKPYMRGEDVKQAQVRLARHLVDVGGIDGIYGPNTRAGVTRFQKARIAEGRDLGSAGADGVVGPKTWAVLWE